MSAKKFFQGIKQLASPASIPQQAASPASSPPPKSAIKVTFGFTQMLIKRLPEIVDGNPVKIAFQIAKAILEIKAAVEDNMDQVDRRIASIAAQLKIAEILSTDEPIKAEAKQFKVHFEKTLQTGFNELKQLSREGIIRKVADHEAEKSKIAEIFENVDEARVQFELAIGIRVFKSVYTIEDSLRVLLLQRLQASLIADHKHAWESKEKEKLYREVCTPGTRVRILDNIKKWAKDTSPDSPSVYWLFGPAGTGKSTIAYTIARRFEFAGNCDDPIILGANFFCSRQFEETKESKRIIRTIVYHLALICEPFANALTRVGKYEAFDFDVQTQIRDLLVKPWKESESARNAASTPLYLVVIDALDEIVGNQNGSDFLRDLFKAINRNQLRGLKFFATSRPDPELVTHVESFRKKQFYCLQDVAEREVRGDIKIYLNVRLPHSVCSDSNVLEKIMNLTGGLFVYAATVVKYAESHASTAGEQKNILEKLVSNSGSDTLFNALDLLYLEVLRDAFGHFEGDILMNRLAIFHAFLLTTVAATSIGDLLFPKPPNTTHTDFSFAEIAKEVLKSLHAVLYTNDSRVLVYHKSFSDFIFNQNRAKEFWCDSKVFHRRLAESCFRVMNNRLEYNIVNFSSSSCLYDRDNHSLRNEVDRKIPLALRYSCMHWSRHLGVTKSTTPEPLCGTLSKFLRLRVLFWIEAMNLLGYSDLCSGMLGRARSWVMKEDQALAGQLDEAACFAMYFSGSEASFSTPHLYITALARWPRNLEPCRGWKDHFSVFTMLKLRGGTLLIPVPMEIGPSSVIAFSRDDLKIVTGSRKGFIRVRDASTGKVHKELKSYTRVRSLAFSDDGTWIVSGSGNKVQVWDASTGEMLNVLKGHTKSVTSVTFSNDKSWIVSGSSDKSVRLWDASTGVILKVLEGHTKGVLSVAISTRNNSAWVASGSDDESVRLWHVPSGTVFKLFVMKGHNGGVLSVAFSSCGSRLVSGSRDQIVRVWELMDDKVSSVIHCWHHAPVSSVAFSPSGTRFFSGSCQNNLVKEWDGSDGDFLCDFTGYKLIR